MFSCFTSSGFTFLCLRFPPAIVQLPQSTPSILTEKEDQQTKIGVEGTNLCIFVFSVLCIDSR